MAGTVILTWSHDLVDVTGFKIQHSTDGVSYSVVATVAAPTLTYTHTPADNRNTNYYKVAAYNDDGDSDYTSPSSIKCSIGISADTGVSGQGQGAGSGESLLAMFIMFQEAGL